MESILPAYTIHYSYLKETQIINDTIVSPTKLSCYEIAVHLRNKYQTKNKYLGIFDMKQQKLPNILNYGSDNKINVIIIEKEFEKNFGSKPFPSNTIPNNAVPNPNSIISPNKTNPKMYDEPKSHLLNPNPINPVPKPNEITKIIYKINDTFGKVIIDQEVTTNKVRYEISQKEHVQKKDVHIYDEQYIEIKEKIINPEFLQKNKYIQVKIIPSENIPKPQSEGYGFRGRGTYPSRGNYSGAPRGGNYKYYEKKYEERKY